ncbi:MAG: 4-alpha-glucanotransferase, partial [Ruthenibacterium sp.]
GQRVWQLLPLSPTSFGDSPYQSFSAFAGNPYFIDLDLLRRDGLLTAQECADALAPAGKIDYAALYETRLPLLQRAAECWDGGEELARFEREQGFWLADYALFMAAKRHFSMRPWTQWEDGALRLREPQKLEEYGNLLAGDILFFKKLQCLFFRQWRALREYCAERGLQLFGDLPIYVALDSADVWAAPEDFLLDENRQPTAVAGVPPDAFTSEGQLWGNPLYNWEKMERDGFGWWIRRIGAARALFDLLRIDHFRGFESYWAVPAGAKTAREGAWHKGPGEKLVCALRSWFADFPLIAEDLGELTPAVRELLEKSGLLGMRVLEFAFDAEGDSPYQMHNYVKN